MNDNKNQKHVEDYAVPQGVKLLTVGIDKATNRFEREIVGWGAGHRATVSKTVDVACRAPGHAARRDRARPVHGIRQHGQGRDARGLQVHRVRDGRSPCRGVGRADSPLISTGYPPR